MPVINPEARMLAAQAHNIFETPCAGTITNHLGVTVTVLYPSTVSKGLITLGI
jgi:hypothetical protein